MDMSTYIFKDMNIQYCAFVHAVHNVEKIEKKQRLTALTQPASTDE